MSATTNARHTIRFNYGQYRGGEIIYDEEISLTLTDAQIRMIADYIRQGYTSCMIEDLPDVIYDRFEDAAHEALTAAIHEGRTEYRDDDEFGPQMDLPLDLLRLLPKRVLALLESEDLFSFYEVTTWAELFALDLD